VSVQEEDDIVHVRLTCQSSFDLRGDIYQKIKQTDWILLELRQETKSLENIFRDLTEEN
jgi:ABC-2 type transport system ATP-binding protein